MADKVHDGTSSSPISPEKQSPELTLLPTRRMLWAIRRAAMESMHAKSQPRGSNLRRRWELFEQLAKVFAIGLRLTWLYPVGERNARNVVVNRLELPFPDLPQAFDGYRLLHLTDLHLDFIPGIEDHIVAAIDQVTEPLDLAIITGDFRDRPDSGHRQILGPLRKILDRISARDGKYATLGNHDSVDMVPDLERQGLRILTNETVTLERESDRICFTGLDDVHYFYTEQALTAMESSPALFKMIFVHSAEVYSFAARNGYRLYLAGHTHGGQICLPGGYPIVTHHTAGRSRARGLWRHHGLTGYTSCGAGSIALPLRFNAPAEITVITLRRSTKI